MRLWLSLAALGGLACVAFGAFAAHGIADPQARDWLRTGATYGAIHCLAVFAAALVRQMGGAGARFAAPLFLVGVVLFAGSLWAMALGAPRWLGAVTPIGGLLFMTGWLVLAWAAWRLDSPPQAQP